MPLMRLPRLTSAAPRRSAVPRVPWALAGSARQPLGPAEPARDPHSGHNAYPEGGRPGHPAAPPGVDPGSVEQSA